MPRLRQTSASPFHFVKSLVLFTYSPQSNGVAKRKNRTLNEMMNAVLISSYLPQSIWGEVILSANYLLNKVPKKKQRRLHMIYRDDDNHSINTCECGDV